MLLLLTGWMLVVAWPQFVESNELKELGIEGSGNGDLPDQPSFWNQSCSSNEMCARSSNDLLECIPATMLCECRLDLVYDAEMQVCRSRGCLDEQCTDNPCLDCDELGSRWEWNIKENMNMKAKRIMHVQFSFFNRRHLIVHSVRYCGIGGWHRNTQAIHEHSWLLDGGALLWITAHLLAAIHRSMVDDDDDCDNTTMSTTDHSAAPERSEHCWVRQSDVDWDMCRCGARGAAYTYHYVQSAADRTGCFGWPAAMIWPRHCV